jgi:hypothetical protein
MRRQAGVSVLDFLIWLGLAAVVVGSAVVFYQRAQNQQVAFEAQRKLDHLVTKVREAFAGKEFYTRDGTPSGSPINSLWLRSARGPGLVMEDFQTTEFGRFEVGPSLALGDWSSAFRVQSPPFRTNRFACRELVMFAIAYLDPIQVESFNGTVVWTRGGTVSAIDAAAAACAPAAGTGEVSPVRFDFS